MSMTGTLRSPTIVGRSGPTSLPPVKKRFGLRKVEGPLISPSLMAIQGAAGPEDREPSSLLYSIHTGTTSKQPLQQEVQSTSASGFHPESQASFMEKDALIEFNVTNMSLSVAYLHEIHRQRLLRSRQSQLFSPSTGWTSGPVSMAQIPEETTGEDLDSKPHLLHPLELSDAQEYKGIVKKRRKRNRVVVFFVRPPRICSSCLPVPCLIFNDTTLFARCNPQNLYDQLDSSARCDPDFVINPSNQFTKILDLDLKKGNHALNQEAVQIKPQRVKLACRPKEAFDLKLFYQRAEDYPVDLYYLMDLSRSMKDDKDKLSELGISLAQKMERLTSNFRLGFGSFVDKVVMPYVSTVPAELNEPCDSCAAPYGYRNHMSLESNSSRFAVEVGRAKVSGNLDAPEGGFDAIMQAIVCKNDIGWRDKARRLLVFSTDAGFHYAGDGKLGGIVMPNDGHCHLNSRGEYTHSAMLDYPSVSQLNQKVKEQSINIIWAVTSEQRHTYDELSKFVEGSYAGTLSQDSSNVVQLIEQQYAQITSSVEIKDNATAPVRITYYSRCLDPNGLLRQTSKCEGLTLHNRVEFEARIEVSHCPKDPREWKQIVQIYPVGLNESLIVEVDMVCECPCEQPGNAGYKPASIAAECNYEGDLMCGICQCSGDFFGKFCECDARNQDLADSEAGCRPDNATDILCSNRGTCVCGQCECFKRPDPNEIVSGPYCECDNYQCNRHNDELCSGPDHGECVCGQCVCKPGWTGDACSCSMDTSGCQPPDGGSLCSGKGNCTCGVCECMETEAGKFSGKFCAECPTCPGRCEELKSCVECQMFERGPLTKEECEECPFEVIPVEVIEERSEDERQCTFTDEDGCRWYFAYGYNEHNELVVRAQTTKDCPPIINILGIVLGVIGAIVALGVGVLLLWKLLTTIHDRREFAEFKRQQEYRKWGADVNPIFKQATSTFQNPTYKGST
ncbi:unnamed protein product [Cyprideis torosa]|uniref:Integrin beta n=1 Tax=Cyprideis torosa TaxID=163714 RepID=A0A7R8WHD2_9CRUS|nr:unnamed protein product [Cyprideis torosa]CAG0892794.1 unnamed protein product [Cyprideis torosa]